MTSTDGRLSVTFVGHDASRTGAPILLASALRWAGRAVGDRADRRVVLLGGGPLVDEFRSVAPTKVVGGRVAAGATQVAAAARSLGVRDVDPQVALGSLSRVPRGDVVVANTLVSLPFAVGLVRRSRHRTRLVCHVLELDGVVDRVLPEPGRSSLVRHVDRFIATGSAVSEMLVERWRIPEHRVTVVDPWVERDRAVAGPVRTSGRPTVLSVGSMQHRKGPDRFVDLMSLLSSHPTRPAGVWLGGPATNAVGRETSDDIARSGDPGAIRLVPDLADVAPMLASADVVVSTAIEEPYSVAVLEAAVAGIPVAGFASGGIADALGAVGQSDSLVPIDDVVGLAGVVSRLLDDPDERRRRGVALSDWARSTHLVEHLGPRWWDVVAG